MNTRAARVFINRVGLETNKKGKLPVDILDELEQDSDAMLMELSRAANGKVRDLAKKLDIVIPRANRAAENLRANGFAAIQAEMGGAITGENRVSITMAGMREAAGLQGS